MMNLYTTIRYLSLVAVALHNVSAVAYYDEKEKEKCRNPKVQEFTLPVYEAPENKQAPAEAEFSFVVSGWADPKKIKLSGKDHDIPFTVESSDTFHKVKAKLPPELTGKFVRINARIPAVLGCYTSMGWLIKVADKPAAIEAPKPPETVAPAADNPGAAAVQEGITPPASTTQTPQNIVPAPQAPASPPAPADKTDVAP